ncbi:SAP30_Sin3_bdg domain-containing protein [Cephalotus follicularis]|uniref:SAP30_Sin3_bdg domain-containing protein n=1 Tax=Cephalotus follicularis TaxID=3775 RepID=A0A1Q3C7N5_CEPFO|nr:SAP30_Sin3_bdg domain-containing protein [Cephalotus follicularis]
MLEPELCSSRVLSPFREESGDEELSVLPRHTKVIVTGNNRTKSVLVGLQGVVKKAVGLGGWHWLVLKNGVEVKLQRNALSVLEHPTGNEVDDDHDFDSSSGSDIGEKDHDLSSSFEIHKPSKPRVRQTRPWVSSTLVKSANRGFYRDVQSIIQPPLPRVNLAKLGTNSLWRYCKHYKIASINSDSSREQMLNVVQQHFASQPRLDEARVISDLFAAKKLKTDYKHTE